MPNQSDGSSSARVEGPSDPRLRIAQIYWGAEGDGVASHLASFSRAVTRRGHEVTWFNGDPHPKVAIPGVKMVYSELLDLDAPAPHKNDVKRWFANHAANNDFDVVHLHNAHNFRPEIAAGLTELREKIARKKSGPRLKLLHTHHSPFSGPEAEKNATVVNAIPGLAVSEWMRGWAEERGGSVTASPLGVNLERFANVSDLKLPPGKPVTFGIAARMVPNKGIHEFYDAYELMLDGWDESTDGPRPRLLIASPKHSVGMAYEKADGYLQELQAKIALAGHSELVDMINATADEMPDIYPKAAKWFALPKFEEALGLTPMEAAAAGRSSMVTDVGGLPETVEPGRGNIIHFPSSDEVDNPSEVFSRDLSVRMKASAKNRKGLVAEGKRARAFAQQNFNEEQQVNHVLGAYDFLINGATFRDYEKNGSDRPYFPGRQTDASHDRAPSARRPELLRGDSAAPRPDKDVARGLDKEK